MNYNTDIHFRDTTNFKTQLETFISNGELGFSNSSDFYRYISRFIIKNPHVLFDKQGTESSNDVIKYLEALKDSIDIKLERISQQLVTTSRDKRTIQQVFDVVVGELVNHSELRSSKTVRDLEKLYPADLWKDYTPDILVTLQDLGLLQLLPGDKILWKPSP